MDFDRKYNRVCVLLRIRTRSVHYILLFKHDKVFEKIDGSG